MDEELKIVTMKSVEYKKNELTEHEIKEFLQRYFNEISFRSNKLEKLLDIGCGPGNITAEVLITFLNPSFKCIVGADISYEMIEYANKHYSHPKLSFMHMDIEDPVFDKYLHLNFDIITTFFTLHFIVDQKRAVKNIYNLLNKNGDFLCITFGHNQFFDAYIELAKTEKWGKYMYDYECYISPYSNLPDRKAAFECLLSDAGFIDIVVETPEKNFISKPIQGLISSENSMYDRIPDELKEEWINEVIKLGCPTSVITKPDSDFIMPNTLIIATARK